MPGLSGPLAGLHTWGYVKGGSAAGTESPAGGDSALKRGRLSALNHPQICTIYDIGDHNGRPFIMMEYLEGQTLKERIHGQPLPLDEILDIGIRIASALQAAHGRY